MEDWEAEANHRIAEQKVQESIAYQHKMQRRQEEASHSRGGTISHRGGWLLLAIIAGLVILSLLRSGSMLVGRLSATEIVDQYGWSQYLANLAHFDEPDLPGLLVVIAPNQRKKRRVYRNKKGFADVTRLVSAPKGTTGSKGKVPRKGRRRAKRPHYYFLSKDRVPWLQALREAYLGEAKIRSLAARLPTLSRG